MGRDCCTYFCVPGLPLFPALAYHKQEIYSHVEYDSYMDHKSTKVYISNTPHPPTCFHSGFSCTDLVPPAVSQGRRGGQTPSHKVCMRRHHQGELQSDKAPEQSGHTCCHIESVQSEGIKFEPLCECTYADWRIEIL